MGMDTPILANVIAATSTLELCRLAAAIPSGIPTMIATLKAAMVSSSVTGSRSMIIWLTGREKRIDSPRSPLITFPK